MAHARWGLLVVMGGVLVPVASANESPDTATVSGTAAAIETPAPAKPLTPEEQLRAQLDGTQWAIQLSPAAGSKDAKPRKDTVTFTGRQVASEAMSKAGYPKSNYSLTIGDDGWGVWETMQTKEGEGVAFWRGEFSASSMRGVLSKHPIEGPPEDHSFSGQVSGDARITIPAKAAPVVQQPAPQPAAPAAQPATPAKAPAKKKRGWF